MKIYRVKFDLCVARHLRARPLVWFAFIGGAYFLVPGWPFRAWLAARFLAWLAPLRRFGAWQIFAPLFGARRAFAKGVPRRFGAWLALAKGFPRRPVPVWQSYCPRRQYFARRSLRLFPQFVLWRLYSARFVLPRWALGAPPALGVLLALGGPAVK